MKTVTLILLTSALLTAAPAHAQWVNNPQNGMATVTNEAGQDKLPLIVNLSSERYLVLWMRYIEVRAKYQILDQNGNSLLSPNGQFLIAGNWYNCGIKYLVQDGEGGAICVFEDWRSGDRQIYGQRIDADGNRLWGDNGIPLATWTGGDMSLKDVEADSLGNIFLGWAENASPNNRLFVQKVSVAGQRLWGDYGACDFGGISSGDVQQIVPDEQGGVVDVWTDLRLGGSIGRLFAQHLDASGNPLWQQNGIPLYDPGTGEQLIMAVQFAVTDGQGGGVWVNMIPGGHVFNLFRLTGAGVIPWIWTHGGWETYEVNDIIRHPRDGMLWVTSLEPDWYHLYRLDPLTGQQFFGPNGLRVGGQTIVPAQDGVIVLEGQMTPNGNLSAYRVNNGGHLVWQSYVVLHVYLGELGSQAAVSDSSDGAVVAFEDNRISIWADISAQRILANGRLGIPNPPHTPGNAPMPVDLHLTVRPNPFNPTTTFSFTLPAAAQVTLEVYDINGCNVGAHCVRPVGGGGSQGARSAPLQEWYPAGTHEITFDGSGLPSGVYVYRLTVLGSVATPTTVVGKMMLLK